MLILYLLKCVVGCLLAVMEVVAVGIGLHAHMYRCREPQETMVRMMLIQLTAIRCVVLQLITVWVGLGTASGVWWCTQNQPEFGGVLSR